MRFLVFDIETRIDKSLLRQVLFRGETMSDEEAYLLQRDRLRQESGSDFLPLTFHVPVSIAVGDVDEGGHLLALTTLGGGEEAIVREFWRRLESFDGTLVTFNGRNFDLPVLELQALRWGLSLPGYFDDPRRFRARYAERHYDLYDFLSNGGAYRLRGGFDLLGRLAGLRGKADMEGSRVQDEWEAGRLDVIDRYCRDDVLQTYLLLLRVELLRGRIDRAAAESLAAEAAKF